MKDNSNFEFRQNPYMYKPLSPSLLEIRHGGIEMLYKQNIALKLEEYVRLLILFKQKKYTLVIKCYVRKKFSSIL